MQRKPVITCFIHWSVSRLFSIQLTKIWHKNRVKFWPHIPFKSFGNLWGNSYTIFLHKIGGTTCVESNLYKNIEMFRKILSTIVWNVFFSSLLLWTWLKFLKIAIFMLEKKVLWKSTTDRFWKLFNDVFFTKIKHEKYTLQKTLQYRTFAQSSHIIFPFEVWKKLGRQNIEVFRRIGQFTRKRLFT